MWGGKYEDMILRRIKEDEKPCDDCDSQEGHHYCLLRGMVVKNMDIMTCDDFKEKEEN